MAATRRLFRPARFGSKTPPRASPIREVHLEFEASPEPHAALDLVDKVRRALLAIPLDSLQRLAQLRGHLRDAPVGRRVGEAVDAARVERVEQLEDAPLVMQYIPFLGHCKCDINDYETSVAMFKSTLESSGPGISRFLKMTLKFKEQPSVVNMLTSAQSGGTSVSILTWVYRGSALLSIVRGGQYCCCKCPVL